MKNFKRLTLLASMLFTAFTYCCQNPHTPNLHNITYRLATKTERLSLPKRMSLTEFQYVAVTKTTDIIVARCCIDIDLKTKYLNTTYSSVDENFQHSTIRNKLIAFAKNDLTTHQHLPEE